MATSYIIHRDQVFTREQLFNWATQYHLELFVSEEDEQNGVTVANAIDVGINVHGVICWASFIEDKAHYMEVFCDSYNGSAVHDFADLVGIIVYSEHSVDYAIQQYPFELSQKTPIYSKDGVDLFEHNGYMYPLYINDNGVVYCAFLYRETTKIADLDDFIKDVIDEFA